MTERELEQLPYLNKEIEQHQARLQGSDLDPAAYCQSVRHVVAEHRQWVEELLGRRIVERDRLEGYIADIEDEQARLILAYHFAAGMPWKAVAARLGGSLTAAECSKIAGRYLEREAAGPDSFMREVLTLHYSEGLPWKDVARRIGGGNTPSGLRVAASRCLKKQENA